MTQRLAQRLTASNYQLNGVVGSDTIVLNNPTNGIMVMQMLGTNIRVIVSGLLVSGLSVSNYQLASTSINGKYRQYNSCSSRHKYQHEYQYQYEYNGIQANYLPSFSNEL